MFWMLFACTVGSSGPASPDSRSASEAEMLDSYSDKAGALSNAARELEAASAAARNRIVHGANPATEVKKIEEIIARIETLESELTTEHDAMIQRLQSPQSTDETRK